MMNCYVGQQYSVFSVKTVTFLSLVGLLECIVFLLLPPPSIFFNFFLYNLEIVGPFIRWVQVFVSMKCLYLCLYEYRKHIHTHIVS